MNLFLSMLVRSLIVVLVFSLGWPSQSRAQEGENKVEVDFPLGIGLHMPTYDRVNGATVRFGPAIIFGEDRFKLEPTVAYRSHLGKIDPRLRLALQLDSTFSFVATAERGTFTNDAWIRSDFRNSLSSLINGRDTRNYFRSDRLEGGVSAKVGDYNYPMLTIFAGVRWENSWSTGWRDGEQTRGPFSFRHNEYAAGGMARANPLINQGHIGSALASADLQWQYFRGELKGDATIESSWKTPTTGNFTQVTSNVTGTLHTVWGQRFETFVHFMTTGGDPTPIQRYSYLGGTGSVPTRQVLSMGGDRIFLWDINYMIPIPGAEIPYLGPIAVGPKFSTAAAGIRQFGAPAQHYGVRLGIGFIQIDYVQDVKSSNRNAVDISINILQ